MFHEIRLFRLFLIVHLFPEQVQKYLKLRKYHIGEDKNRNHQIKRSLFRALSIRTTMKKKSNDKDMPHFPLARMEHALQRISIEPEDRISLRFFRVWAFYSGETCCRKCNSQMKRCRECGNSAQTWEAANFICFWVFLFYFIFSIFSRRVLCSSFPGIFQQRYIFSYVFIFFSSFILEHLNRILLVFRYGKMKNEKETSVSHCHYFSFDLKWYSRLETAQTSDSFEKMRL